MDFKDFNLDEEDYLSSASGTETIVARDMVPEAFDNTAGAHGVQEQGIQSRRYLKVDLSANKHTGSRISKVWQHGSELRALDTPNLDTQWLCNHYLPAKRLFKVSGTEGNNDNISSPARHLLKVHRIIKEDKDSETSSIVISSPGPSFSLVPSVTAMMTTASQVSYSALISRISTL